MTHPHPLRAFPWPRLRLTAFLGLTLLLGQFLCGCLITRKACDPVVEIETPAGRELGVSTSYGLVFLGSRARSGEVDLVAWYGDGPSIEASVIEPIGGGLYTAEAEIRLPSVELCFAQPEPGSRLMLMGRHGAQRWEQQVTVASHPKLSGILLEFPADLPLGGDQIGAGVFEGRPDRRDPQRLVGLVSGTVTILSEGVEKSYLTVVGPEQLWRLVAWKRDSSTRPHWVYREDVL